MPCQSLPSANSGSCTGYLAHLFGKCHRRSESIPLDSSQKMGTRGKMEGYGEVLTWHIENERIFIEEKLKVILTRLKHRVGPTVKTLRAHILQRTKPLTSSLPLQTLADLGRSKTKLVAENALLRQQLIILKRQVKHPACTKTDRILLVLLARAVQTWKQTLFIVQPETRLALASGALSPALEAQVKGLFTPAQGNR
jgi:hypothetical protein